ncbi:MAG: hypothetical protein AB7F75_07130 [Planctomycetota bacterium]
MKRLLSSCAWVFPMLAGAYMASGHLNDPVWRDEALTLRALKDGTWGTLLSPDDMLPAQWLIVGQNILIWLWTMFGADIFHVMQMRLLPYFCFLASIGLLYSALHRRFGASVALTAASLLALSHMALNYSCQLRAYPMTWLFSALCLRAFLETTEPKSVWTTHATLALSIAGLTAFGPTNLALLIFLAIWLACLRLGRPSKIKILGALGIGLFPLGVLILTHLDQIRQISKLSQEVYNLTSGQVLSEWWSAWILDLPFITWPAIMGIALLARNKTDLGAQTRSILLSILATPPLFLWIMPDVPPTRHLVHLIPIMCAFLSMGMCAIIEKVPHSTWRTATWAALAIMTPAYAIAREHNPASWIPGYRHISSSRDLGVTDFYFHSPTFNPKEVAKYLEENSQGPWSLVALADEGVIPYAMKTFETRWHLNNMQIEQAFRLVDPNCDLRGSRVLIVAKDRDEAENIMRHIGLNPSLMDRATVSLPDGHFKVFHIDIGGNDIRLGWKPSDHTASQLEPIHLEDGTFRFIMPKGAHVQRTMVALGGMEIPKYIVESKLGLLDYKLLFMPLPDDFTEEMHQTLHSQVVQQQQSTLKNQKFRESYYGFKSGYGTEWIVDHGLKVTESTLIGLVRGSIVWLLIKGPDEEFQNQREAIKSIKQAIANQHPIALKLTNDPTGSFRARFPSSATPQDNQLIYNQPPVGFYAEAFPSADHEFLYHQTLTKLRGNPGARLIYEANVDNKGMVCREAWISHGGQLLRFQTIPMNGYAILATAFGYESVMRANHSLVEWFFSSIEAIPSGNP